MNSAQVPLCKVPGLRSVEITAAGEAGLQAFFDANPGYFLAVHGEPAGPREAHREIHGEIPAGWSYTRRWLVGYLDANEQLLAVSHVTTDLLAFGVWHVGLFIVDSAHQGTGLAQALFLELESWAMTHGAQWLRLGVVQGNSRAEHFWASLGFIESRTRVVEMGKRTSTLRVMFKPLAGGTLEQYLSLVPRDRPEVVQ